VEGDYPKVAMSEFIALPERTYGLVIGIEKYLESSWNVKGGGPAHDALKFAQWLCKCGVPKENIQLCLSFLEENSNLIEQSELAIQEATEQNIASLITNFLSEKKGDLLYIFWAGHGLITSERDRRLLCADATKRNWQNLDLNSLLVFLSSEAFQIQNHICIVDACANYILESKERPTNLGGKIFSSGQPRKGSQQFVLLATREGEQAKISAEGKTGYFSQAVREALEEEANDSWPPNMKTITEKVKHRFVGLDKKQLPTYFYCRSWDGDKDVYHPNDKLTFSHIGVDIAKLSPGARSDIQGLSIFDFDVVTVNIQGKIIDRQKRQAKCFTENLGESINLNMVFIPGGRFLMGSSDFEVERNEDEKPQHEVIVQPFFMGKHQVTQAQWRVGAALPEIDCKLNPDPSYFKGDSRPVESISWYEIEEFCQRLSKYTGHEYRLPSEVEWEYACRAGTMTPFHFGETLTTELANYLDSCVYEELVKGKYVGKTTTVMKFLPNAFGLYDMHGNVKEWCSDHWHTNYREARSDGNAWVTGGNNLFRILRGGSGFLRLEDCRSANRHKDVPSNKSHGSGFRLACSSIQGIIID
jgi:formylglycine-generating enzyme required for sulfatase activity